MSPELGTIEIQPDRPTLEEAAATMLAVSAYAEALGDPVPAAEMSSWLRRLEASCRQLRAITR